MYSRSPDFLNDNLYMSNEGMSTKCCVQQQRAGEAENRSGTALEYGPGGTAFESS